MEKGTTFVGLDVHKEAINVAMLPPGGDSSCGVIHHRFGSIVSIAHLASTTPRSVQHCGSAAKRCPRPSGRRGHRAAPQLALRVPP